MSSDHKIKTRPVAWAALIAILGFFWWVFATAGNAEPSSATSTTSAETAAQQQATAAKKTADKEQKAKVRQDTIAALAPVYCNNHSSIQMSKDNTLAKDGWPVYSSVDDVSAGRGIHGFSADQCTTIITKFYDLGTPRNELDNIVASKVWIGMSWIELVYSIGSPDDINTTATAAGTHQQWVYGSNYVYVDEGKVTAYRL